MSPARPEMVLASAPFVRGGVSTPRIMLEVVLVALVALAGAVWHFGVGALLVVAASTLGALATEAWFSRGKHPSPLWDGSALLTGVLLGLTLPPVFPLWMAFLGGIAGIGLGKLVWGGLGQNIFNPALVGRAFLQASFPTQITTWSAPDAGLWHVSQRLLAPPMLSPVEVDGWSGATPLGLMKFQDTITDPVSLMIGSTGGSLGETTALLLLACGAWLFWRKIADWRPFVATLGSTALFSGILWAAAPQKFPDPLFMVLSGGVLFASVFMVTDPVTTPTTPRGAWLFGLGVGFLVVIIRLFGGLPEGVMYAVLLMNALSPYLERITQPRPFGGAR